MSISRSFRNPEIKNYAPVVNAILKSHHIQRDVPFLGSVDDAIEFILRSYPHLRNPERLKYFLLHQEDLYRFDDYFNFRLMEEHPLETFFLEPYGDDFVIDTSFTEKILYNRYLFEKEMLKLLEGNRNRNTFYLKFREGAVLNNYVVVADTKEQALAKFLLSNQKIMYVDAPYPQDSLNVIIYDRFFIDEEEYVLHKNDFGSFLLELCSSFIKVEDTILIE